MAGKMDEIKAMLDRLNPDERQNVFDRLKEDCIVHPLERDWHAPAFIILDAISQSGDLTQRGVKGVIADRTFHRIVVPKLADTGWTSKPILTDEMYDADLEQNGRRVTVQVKMQRREKRVAKIRYAGGEPHWVVEVQKTRSGKDANGNSTRPYAYGSFDILAVNLYASCEDWSCYRYTVANWLLPKGEQTHLIDTMQPVSKIPSDLWTDDFDEAVSWLASGQKRQFPSWSRPPRKAQAKV